MISQSVYIKGVIISYEKTDYKSTAQLFVEMVGGKSNIESYMHCVTRMRFNIVDKEKVYINKIKTSKLVKGTNWSSNQFQIILGSGVLKQFMQKCKKF